MTKIGNLSLVGSPEQGNPYKEMWQEIKRDHQDLEEIDILLPMKHLEQKYGVYEGDGPEDNPAR